MILDYLTNPNNIHNRYGFSKLSVQSSEGDFSFIETVYNNQNYPPSFMIADACKELQKKEVRIMIKNFEKVSK